jgi:Predicted nucleotide-utilizing enzyme related to molybdopterin-biosynthesis enzyme MoeA
VWRQGVPSILNRCWGGLKNDIVGGDPFLSHTISLRTVESEIAKSLTEVQNNNKDVEIGSYPFFQAGKLGVSIVIRSEDQKKINICETQILEFVKEKKIDLVNKN